jgi:hypothetical protein
MICEVIADETAGIAPTRTKIVAFESSYPAFRFGTPLAVFRSSLKRSSQLHRSSRVEMRN